VRQRNIADTYSTLADESTGIFKDKGSKFISFACPVKTEEETRIIIDRIKKEHHSARHHCYAYKLGASGEIYRMNDDGEPSGTGGKPIYGQILSANITNILIVVVRYFGGTLLGVGGLINAYRSAARNALENGSIIKKSIDNIYHIQYNYEDTGAVMRVVSEENLSPHNQKYEEKCEMDIAIRKSKCDKVIRRMEKINSVAVRYMTTR